jgi:hypothetical protein
MTEFGFFATALMVLLYAAGVLAVVVIGACVLPSVIRQRSKRVQAAESAALEKGYMRLAESRGDDATERRALRDRAAAHPLRKTS